MNGEELSIWLKQSAKLARDLCFDSEAEKAEYLHHRLMQKELYLAFVGATSSGKSTVINNLIRKNILPTYSVPTTGSMAQIRIVGNEESETYYSVNSLTNQIETIDKTDFVSLASKSSDNTYLVAEIPYNGTLSIGSILIDVPGYNSLNSQHDAVLVKWLPQMDCIVWVIDAKRGFAKSDTEFWKLVKETNLELLSDTVTLLVNCPDKKFEKRIPSIQELTKKECGIDPKTFTAHMVRREERYAILNMKDFENDLQEKLNDAQRHALLFERIYTLSGNWLNNLKLMAESLHKQKITDPIKRREKLNERMSHLEKQRHDSLKIIKGIKEKWQKINIGKILQKTKENLWVEIESYIDRGSTINAKETADHIINFVIRDASTNAYQTFTDKFENEIQVCCEKVETIFMDSISCEWIPDICEMNFDPNQAHDVKVIKTGTKKLISSYLNDFFASMGGRAKNKGVTSIMNLSRKGMKNINITSKKIGGKTVFGRSAMRKVGPLLKKYGITTNRVMNSVVLVATETFTFIYKSMTWKSKLKSKLKKMIEYASAVKGNENQPLLELHNTLIMVVSETALCLTEEVGEIYQRRLAVLNAEEKKIKDEKLDEQWQIYYEKLKELTL